MAYRENAAFAELLRGARRRRRMTQETLAYLSGVGRRTIVRWESGEGGEPKPAEARAVLDVLGVPAVEVYRSLGWLPAGDDGDERVASWPSAEDMTTDELHIALREALTAAERYGAEIQRRLEAPPPERARRAG